MNVNKINSINANQTGAPSGTAGSIGGAGGATGAGGALESFVKQQFDIRSLNPGEIFQGRITDIRNNTITIQVNNQLLQAKYDNNVNVTLGQELQFLVKENKENQVIIKPLTMEGFTPMDNTIYKALDGAALPPTNKNFDAAAALFNHQMSLDKQSLTSLLSKAYLFPETPISHLALMIKNGIEVTNENITQFEHYVNGEHQLSGDLNKLIRELPDIIKQIHDQQGAKAAMEFVRTLTGREFISESQLDLWISKDSFKKDFSEELLKQISLKPEELTREKLSDTYKSIADKLNIMEEHLAEAGGKAKDTMQTVSNVKDNLQFMKNLNENFIYTQLPLHLKEKVTHSDLYIFANKKNKGTVKDTFSLLLHLDMDHLGSTEVYVKLHNNCIETKFSLPDEDSVKIVKENMVQLEENLHKKGFVFSSQVEQKNFGQEIDFEKDFLEKDETKIEVTRYSFDMRA